MWNEIIKKLYRKPPNKDNRLIKSIGLSFHHGGIIINFQCSIVIAECAGHGAVSRPAASIRKWSIGERTFPSIDELYNI